MEQHYFQKALDNARKQERRLVRNLADRAMEDSERDFREAMAYLEGYMSCIVETFDVDYSYVWGYVSKVVEMEDYK